VDRFEHGVFLVTLDAITDPALVPGAIAHALGLRDTGEEAMATQVTAYLRDRRTLLVPDNLEQVIDAATFIGELLVTAPGIKVLATSRVRLQITGEHEYPVRPFALPDLRHASDVAATSQYESVPSPSSVPRPLVRPSGGRSDNAPAIAEICTRLDGLPLAIELAAARIRILPPEAMLGRLTARLPILTGGARTCPPGSNAARRDRVELTALDARGPGPLPAHAVFSGGATIEAVQRVVVGEGDDLDVLDGARRHRATRRSQPAAPGSRSGEPRFSMFETFREYGLERLADAGELDEARRRHADWIRALTSEFRYEIESTEFLGLARARRRRAGQPAFGARVVAETVARDGSRHRRRRRTLLAWRSHFREGHDWSRACWRSIDPTWRSTISPGPCGSVASSARRTATSKAR